MVETSSPKPSSKVADNKSNPPYKVRLVKGSKPLIHHKFYLDIEKHHIATRIENKIKELGGSIEFFLNKDITHFITDKQVAPSTSRAFGSQSNSQYSATTAFSPVTPQTPLSIAESLPSPSNETKPTKQISRADAILLRARQQQSTPLKQSESSAQEKSQSPIQIARSWGRPVWTPEHAIKFLDKVCAALKVHAPESEHSKRSDKVKILRGDYLKIETLDKQYRPFYSELKKWPSLNLKAPLSHGPFECESETRKKPTHGSQGRFRKFSKVDSRTNTTNTGKSKSKTVGTIMTRKSRPQHGGGGQQQQQQQQQQQTATTKTTTQSKGDNNKSSDKQCGYCEICHVEYDVLRTHLKSDEHQNFVKNDDNFAALDRLIESGASVKNLLKLAPKAVNGLKRSSNHLTNGSGTEEESDVAENGINGVDTSDGELGGSPKMRRRCTAQQKNNNRRETRLTQESHESNDKSAKDKAQAARMRGLRWNAPSPESRPPVKEPPVYKVDKHGKDLNATTSKKDDAGKQVVVKLKRVRQSELNLLNNEAEQFMFPKTPTYTDSDTDEDRQTTDHNKSKNETIETVSSCEKEIRTPPIISPTKKRSLSRRLEANLSETSQRTVTTNSRGHNRFPEAPIQPQVTTPSHWLQPEDRMGDNLKTSTVSRWANFRPRYQSIQTKFNFERVPHNEPWYVTFRRQDEGRERVYEYFGNSTYCKLPYEMGPLPPLRDDCCNLTKLLAAPKVKGGTCATPRKRGGSSAYPRMPSIAKVTDRTRSSTAAIIEATRAVDAADDTDSQSTKSKLFLPLKKRKLFLDDMPRKSPREHPSTLAILSSMTNPASVSGSSISRRHRDRLNSQVSMDDDENSNSTITSQQTTRTQATEKDNSSVCSISNKASFNYVNYVKLSKEIDDMLQEKPDPTEFPDDLLEDELDIQSDTTPISSNIGDLSSIIDLCSHEELSLKSVNTKEREAQRKVTYSSQPLLVTSGFRLNKKRRNNRTGWPARRKISSTKVVAEVKDDPDPDPGINEDVKIIKNSLEDEKTLTPDMFAVSSDSLDSQVVDFMMNKNAKEYDSAVSERLTEDEDEENDCEEDDNEDDDDDDDETKHHLPSSKKLATSPRKSNAATAKNAYNKGKYQFEKFPKINITPITSNMKTRSSDLQKRKSITPKKYADESSSTSHRSPRSPNKYSPRKLRKPRGCWYRER